MAITRAVRLKAWAATRTATLLFSVQNNLLLIIGLGIILGLIMLPIYWSWEFWSEVTYQNGHFVPLRVDRGRIIQQSIIIVGGLVGLSLALWRSWTAKVQADVAIRQADLANEDMTTIATLGRSKC